jgi:hypothetical protein
MTARRAQTMANQPSVLEIIVRFEMDAGAGDESGATVRGSVTRRGQSERPAIRFDGWLQLLGLLEDLSAMTDESPEPPYPLPSTGLR